MAMLQQRSKTIYREPKVHLATRFFILSFILCTFLLKGQTKIDDQVLFQKVLKENKMRNGSKNILINPSNDNGYLISLIEQFQKADNSNNPKMIDSLKRGLGIDDKIFAKIFNRNEYENFVSQREKSEWNFRALKIEDSEVFAKSKKHFGRTIFIGKPIYTLHKHYALVPTSSYIIIYERLKNDWKELSIFNPVFR